MTTAPRLPASASAAASDPTSAAFYDGVANLIAQQHADGRFEGEVSWNPLMPAQYVMACALTGTTIGPQRRRRIVRHFAGTQLPSGQWGLHRGGDPSLLATALVYVAARLLGEPAEAELLCRARRFIHKAGGPSSLPTWGRIWLTVLNLHPWAGIPPLIPELWLLPKAVPIHPMHFNAFTRLSYLAVATLYARRTQTPLTPLLQKLRGELYADGYPRPEATRAALRRAPNELHVPPSPGLRFLYGTAQRLEPWFPEAARKRAIRRLVEQIRGEARLTGGRCCSPIDGLLSWMALWSVDPNSADVATLRHGVEHWVWEDDAAGFRMAVTRTQSWDTAWALHALVAAGEHVDATQPIAAATAAATGYLRRQQLAADEPELVNLGRVNPAGGFCPGSAAHHWPTSDATAEVLGSLLDARAAGVASGRLQSAARFLLQCQNDDGSFGSRAPRPTRVDLEWLNASEIFGGCMNEVAAIESTAACIGALARANCANLADAADWPRADIRHAVARGVRFLRRHQRMDGCWPGEFGVHYLYGTAFAVRGLREAGVPVTDPQIKRACRWAAKQQNDDGGWGESPRSAWQRHFVAAPSNPVQTSWGMLIMLLGGSPDWSRLQAGANYLVQSQNSESGWDLAVPAGVLFETALLDYGLYSSTFPVLALSLFLSRRHERLQKR